MRGAHETGSCYSYFHEGLSIRSESPNSNAAKPPPTTPSPMVFRSGSVQARKDRLWHGASGPTIDIPDVRHCCYRKKAHRKRTRRKRFGAPFPSFASRSPLVEPSRERLSRCAVAVHWELPVPYPILIDSIFRPNLSAKYAPAGRKLYSNHTRYPADEQSYDRFPGPVL